MSSIHFVLYRYFIKISFDGTSYNGWQVQKNSAETIQQKINDGLSRLLNEKISVLGCCRTDTGVHAKELYAHFDSSRTSFVSSKGHDWLHKFNSMLPVDISIDRILPVKPDVNARFDATARTYEYHIHRNRDPFLLNRSYYYYSEPDVALMNKAAAIMKTFTDFSAFSKINEQTRDNQCKIYNAAWKKNGEGKLVFTITANRFLRGMVRMTVGTMMLAGKHKITPAEFKKIIESRDSRNAGALVPACGLYLSKVEYPKKIFIK